MVFSEVAFQISSEKQVQLTCRDLRLRSEIRDCSADMPRSTVRPPSRQLNFVPPALLSLFHLLSEAGVDVCFFLCKRWRFDGQDSFINLPFRFWFHVPHLRVNTPTAEAKYKNNNSIHLKFYFRITGHTEIARSRGMNARCVENMRVSNRGHRP